MAGLARLLQVTIPAAAPYPIGPSAFGPVPEPAGFPPEYAPASAPAAGDVLAPEPDAQAKASLAVLTQVSSVSSLCSRLLLPSSITSVQTLLIGSVANHAMS